MKMAYHEINVQIKNLKTEQFDRCINLISYLRINTSKIIQRCCVVFVFSLFVRGTSFLLITWNELVRELGLHN